MKRRIFSIVLALALLMLGLYVISPSYRVGQVTLISSGTRHSPQEFTLHSLRILDGRSVSASGIPFHILLEDALETMPEISYTDDLQIVVRGRFGEIDTGRQAIPGNHNGIRLIGVFPEDFTDGAATISLPDETGTYLVVVDVRWSGRGEEFTIMRYVFKIVR